VRVPAGIRTATRMSTVLGASMLEAVAVEWAEQALWIRLTGHPDAVRDRAGQVPALLDATDVEVLDGDDEQAVWQRLIAALAGEEGQTVVRAACLPSQLPEAVEALADVAEAAEVSSDIGAHAMLGVMTARLSGGAPAAHAACIARWRDRLRPLGGHAVVRRRIDGVDQAVDVWGPPPSAIDLMRRVKRELDPSNRCAPGRFVGGI
jgi:glycolate oxidase FAD binding subunit